VHLQLSVYAQAPQGSIEAQLSRLHILKTAVCTSLDQTFEQQSREPKFYHVLLPHTYTYCIYKAMTTPPLTEKLVYLTLQGVFVGEDSHIRKRKAIRNTIRKHHTNAEIRALTLKYNIDTISTMAKTLLEDQIFASKAKAKLRFPDIFESPTTKSTTLKPAVATSSATAIQPTVTSSDTASSSAAAAQHAVGVDSPEELVGIGDTLKARKEREKIENSMLTQGVLKPS
jgi:hypothetical protein